MDGGVGVNENAEYWFKKGNKFFNEGEYEKAIECYKKVTQINPKDAEAWNNKGVAYDKLGDYKKAIKCYNKVIEIIEINPEIELKYVCAEAWYNKGIVYHKLKDYKKAIECYNKTIKINPEHVDAWYNKGIAYNKLKNYRRALKCFDKVTKIRSIDVKAWLNKGVIYDELRDYKKAIECYDKAIEIIESGSEIELKYEYTGAWINKGVAYDRLGNYKKALECYNKAIEIDPDNEYALYNKAEVLYNSGIYEYALENCKKIINKEKNLIQEAYFLIGKIKLAEKKLKIAIENFKKAKESKVTHILPSLWNVYTRYLKASFELSENKKLFEKELTFILLDLERLEGIVESEKSIVLKKIFYYWLGSLYFKLDDIISAKQKLEKCLQIKSNKIKNVFNKLMSTFFRNSINGEEDKTTIKEIDEKARILLRYIFNYRIKPSWWRWWLGSPCCLNKWTKRIIFILLSFSLAYSLLSPI